MKFKYYPQGVCSKEILLDIEDDIIVSTDFLGGCNGNLQGISHLIAGMKVDDVIERLSGISCGGKGTSCPDQLSRCLIQYKEEMEKISLAK